ncbi:unnamed protein product, partial [Effrenium voratum]
IVLQCSWGPCCDALTPREACDMDTLKYPVSCLFQDGRVWRELIVLEELAPRNWLVVTADWVMSDTLGFAVAESQRLGLPCFFGDPTRERFQDEEAALCASELPCHWMRCTADGRPLPNLLQGVKFHPSSIVKGPVPQGEILPRGSGRGRFGLELLQKLVHSAKKAKTCMLPPREFLVQACDVWLRLRYLLTQKAHKDIQIPNEEGDDGVSEDEAPEDEESESTEHIMEFMDKLQKMDKSHLSEAQRKKMEEEKKKKRLQALKFKMRQSWLKRLHAVLRHSWDLLSPQTR